MGKPSKIAKAALEEFLDVNDAVFDSFIELSKAKGVITHERINEYKVAYQEFVATERECFKEKGGKSSIRDIEAKIPNNIWLRWNLKIASVMKE